MLGVENLIDEFLKDVTLCPKCGAPSAIYEYVLTTPFSGNGEAYIRIEYRLECELCGHKEAMKGSMPLRVAYNLRHIFIPKVRVQLEKAYLAVKNSSLP